MLELLTITENGLPVNSASKPILNHGILLNKKDSHAFTTKHILTTNALLTSTINLFGVYMYTLRNDRFVTIATLSVQAEDRPRIRM